MTLEAKTRRSPARRALLVGQPGSYALRDAMARCRARGIDVLDLKGVSPYEPPRHVLEAASAAAWENGHAPSWGLLELRRAIAAKLERENKIQIDPEREVVVTNGAMQAVNVTLLSLLDPGDQVLMHAPIFFFEGMIRLAGAEPVYASMPEENGFALDAARLAEQVTPRTKAILVNTPVNPTGYVFSLTDIEALAEVVRRHDLWLISDESYEKLVYSGRLHHSPAAHPLLRDRTITLHSFTKSYSLGGWRIGYVAAPAPIAEIVRNIVEWQVLRCNYAAQRAALAALSGPQDWVGAIRADFEDNRDQLVAELAGVVGCNFTVPAGGPSVFLKLPVPSMEARRFSELLLEHYGVPTVPGEHFGSNHHVRLQFGATKATLGQLVERLREGLPELARAV